MPALTFLQKFMPLFCMVILAAVFTNTVYYQLWALPQFLVVLGEWGFEPIYVRRMIARGVIAYQLACLVCLYLAIGTGLTGSRHFGYMAWKYGRVAVVGLFLFLQVATVLYVALDPPMCGCGSLALRIDGWLEELWLLARLPRPVFSNTFPVVRNVLLSVAAVIGISRGKMKKAHE